MNQPLWMILHRLKCHPVHSYSSLQLSFDRLKEVWLQQTTLSFQPLSYRLWTIKEGAWYRRQIIARSHLLFPSYNCQAIHSTMHLLLSRGNTAELQVVLTALHQTGSKYTQWHSENITDWQWSNLHTSNKRLLSHKIKKGKGRYSSSCKPHLRATGCHLPYGITQCYLSPNTSEHAPPNPSHAGWYSIYLLRRNGRLSWPSWLDSALAGSRTSDLLITRPMPNHCTTKTTS